MPKTMKINGRRLAELRNQGPKGKVHQGVLAEEVGISRSYLSELETGSKTPTVWTVERIVSSLNTLKNLDITVEDLAVSSS